MSKRFTATDKWDDPWFYGLSDKEKLFWLFILDKCDHAGIYRPNMPLLRAYIPGFEPDSHLKAFEGRIQKKSPEKWFIPKFIEFQYGTLNPDNRAHLSVINALKKEGLYKPLISSLQGAKDKDKDKDKDSSLGKSENPLTAWFEELWARYPKKDGRKAAERHFRATVDSEARLGEIRTALDNYLKSVAGKDLQYVKNGSTWFNNWEDWVEKDGGGETWEQKAAREAQAKLAAKN